VAAAARLACLRAAGVRIAVDDFGTGYASLAWLTTLPLDMIKIDRGLIIDLVGGRRAQIVVKALIALARELDLQVLVEGVEDPDQLALLKSWNCDYYQGFLGASGDGRGGAGGVPRMSFPISSPVTHRSTPPRVRPIRSGP
jgi:EAL domain-containing protein (putative c-di-GMP-specific phosphodiesterase class I)